ncbi:hypothetical protein AVEN_156876-1 [Araneus ventricosus]|uniref:Integrase catalytic domain-containing protein n=1 Tax=Araneus ventricosus TaxID=182803 RepID=A0A4Y2EMY1_ARAVE|nr:hypothetical protein AVEN_156876-1 [Araneus ventricosus]
MKRTIFVKFPDGSDELICNQSTRLAAVSHLYWNKGPGSRFLKSSGQFPKCTAQTHRTHVTHSTKACTTCNRLRKTEVKAVVSGGDWRVEVPAGGGRGAAEYCETNSESELHIFVDASKTAYAAFVSVGTKWTSGVKMHLLRSKSRNGRPSVVYTDDVDNVKGTFLEFKNLNWMKIERETEIKRIKWELIPPTTPWCGRWWERLLIKLKDLLKRTLGKAVLTYEELLTVSCDYESIINSRPLIYVSEDLDYQVPITPAMFLMTNSYLVVTDLDLRERWTLKLANIDQNIENLFVILIFYLFSSTIPTKPHVSK